MKSLLIGLVALILAGCGGGSSNPIGTPPTPQPLVYQAQLVFKGPLAGSASGVSTLSGWRSVQSMNQRGILAAPGATPVPIMIVTAPDTNSGPESSAFGGEVQAVVSPMPSASPTVTFSSTDAVAVINTPQPPVQGQTPQPLPPGVVSQAFVNGNGAVQTQSAGNAAAVISAPVGESPTTAVYSYMSIALDCSPASAQSILPGATVNHFGWQWTGSTWIPDDNVATADIYIDGTNPGSGQPCMAPNPAESEITVHIPGGDTRITSDTPFSSVAASQWANTETSFTLLQAAQLNPDGSNNGFVIGKTRDGLHVFKLFPNAIGYTTGFFGAIGVSGDSVDGF